jgi:hypothetical protein
VIVHDHTETPSAITLKPASTIAEMHNRGYRGVQPPKGVKLLLSHTRGMPRALKKLLKRRQAIEPTIGHMKADGLLARNWLKGSEGDAIHAVLCCAGHNIRLILDPDAPAGASLSLLEPAMPSRERGYGGSPRRAIDLRARDMSCSGRTRYSARIVRLDLLQRPESMLPFRRCLTTGCTCIHRD